MELREANGLLLVAASEQPPQNNTQHGGDNRAAAPERWLVWMHHRRQMHRLLEGEGWPQCNSSPMGVRLVEICFSFLIVFAFLFVCLFGSFRGGSHRRNNEFLFK